MEYFIWFCLCYTLYRGYVMVDLGLRAAHEYYRARKVREAGWASVENSVQDDECADAVGYHAIHNKAYHNVRPTTLCGE